MTNLLEDPIARLRGERPNASTDTRLQPDMSVIARARTAQEELLVVGPAARRTRHAVRVAIVATFTLIAVLSGVQVLTRTHGSSRPTVTGISQADAREAATQALIRVATLTNFDSTSSWLTMETAAPHRTDGRRSHVIAIDGERSTSTATRNDFVGRPWISGLETRIVDHMTFHRRAATSGPSWILDAHSIGAPYRREFTGDPNSMRPPNFTQLVNQLTREDLIDARRTSHGTIVIEIARPARELAPLDGTATGISDPIATFALGMSSYPTPPTVHVRITIGSSGALQALRVWADVTTTFADGSGRGIQLPARVSQELTWRDVTDRKVAAPDPLDVLVVGNYELARHGLKGAAGVQGTMDTFSFAQLKGIQRTSIAAGQRLPSRPRPKVTESHDYTAYFARNARLVKRAKALVDAYKPFNRAKLALDPNCSPFWPASGRAMPRSQATDPERVGWLCELRGGIGSFSLKPGEYNYRAQMTAGTGITVFN
jgi:hypothetical protein